MPQGSALMRRQRRVKQKAANGMSLAAFVRGYGGAGGIWTPVRQPLSSRSTCLVVWFGSRPDARAATRLHRRQHPIVSLLAKVPGQAPADVNDLTAWTMRLSPHHPCPAHRPAVV